MVILKLFLKKFHTVSHYIILLAYLFGVASCSDSSNDTEKPKIALELPKSNDTIRLSVQSQIPIVFTATDNDELHEVKVTLKNSKGDELYSDSKDVDAAEYRFQHNYVPTGITVATQFILKIEASDHHDNETELEINFIVIP